MGNKIKLRNLLTKKHFKNMSSIGIDLGTTYSCVGVFQNDKVEIIPNDQGLNTTPSYVAFTEEKRLIGRKFSDKTVQDDIKLWPFKVEQGPGEKPLIQVQFKGETKKFQAEEISSMVLVKMKEVAETYLGKPV